MPDVIFALFLTAFNFVLFLSMKIVNVRVKKKTLAALLVIVLAVIVAFFASNPEKYRATFFMSLALFLVMGLRFIVYKFLAPTTLENDTPGGRLVRNFFDLFLFPFFILFISFGQIMFLFVLNT